jgi:hypothetical protein
MGNFRSGRLGRRGGRRSTESLPEARLTYQCFSITAGSQGPRVLPCGAKAQVVHDSRVWLVDIAATPLRFGGSRRWLVCPLCLARRVALYVAGERLACRRCLNLSFASEHESDKDRTIRRAARIRARLGWRGGVLDREGGRPRGMHKLTYLGLKAQYDLNVSELIQMLDMWARLAYQSMDRFRPTLAAADSGESSQSLISQAQVKKS